MGREEMEERLSKMCLTWGKLDAVYSADFGVEVPGAEFVADAGGRGEAEEVTYGEEAEDGGGHG